MTQIETLTVPDVQIGDPALEDEPPEVAHIVAREDNATAGAIVTEAMVNGTPVTALCGFVWVPSRDPKDRPVCQACADALKAILEMRGSL
jgi:hypothetical protein